MGTSSPATNDNLLGTGISTICPLCRLYGTSCNVLAFSNAASFSKVSFLFLMFVTVTP